MPNQGACPAKVAKADASAPWYSTVGPLLAILARSLIRPSLPSTYRGDELCISLTRRIDAHNSTVQSSSSRREHQEVPRA